MRPELPKKGGFDPKKIEEDRFVVDLQTGAKSWDDFFEVTVDTHDTILSDDENLWVVAIISKGCGSCEELLNDYQTITSAENLAGRSLKFGYVDHETDEGQEWMAEYAADLDIEYTPTILIFGKDKTAPVVYDGLYVHDPINEYICNQCEVEGFNGTYDADDGKVFDDEEKDEAAEEEEDDVVIEDEEDLHELAE